MIIDCGTCAAKPSACSDCVVSVLLGPPPENTLTNEEQRVVALLAGSGLVPPLRMVSDESDPSESSASGKMAG